MRAVQRGLLIGGLVVIVAGQATTQQMDTAFFTGLFTTPIGQRVGDIVTVIISETTQATHQASQSHENKTKTQVGPGEGKLQYIPLVGGGLGYSASSSSSAKASAARQQTLYTRVSAKIVEITPTGNYRIEGQRLIRVNRDVQRLTVRGEVRPQDIGANNIIYSQDIVDAEISYKGSDPARPGKRVGLVTRLLNWLF